MPQSGLSDFVGPVDYSINESNGIITLTMTNISSVTSGTLGKELLPSSVWPNGRTEGPKSHRNFAQTFSLTFQTTDVKAVYKEKPKK
jgi:hypothetical protein